MSTRVQCESWLRDLSRQCANSAKIGSKWCASHRFRAFEPPGLMSDDEEEEEEEENESNVSDESASGSDDDLASERSAFERSHGIPNGADRKDRKTKGLATIKKETTRQLAGTRDDARGRGYGHGHGHSNGHSHGHGHGHGHGYTHGHGHNHDSTKRLGFTIAHAAQCFRETLESRSRDIALLTRTLDRLGI